MTDTARHEVEEKVERSNSSFYWAMRLLPQAQREAMYAVYAFCRAVDDVADGSGTAEERLAALQGWRKEVVALFEGRPTFPVTLALLEPVRVYNLERCEFEAMLDGMEMDIRGRSGPFTLAELQVYCRKVAGAVGLLAIRIFGAGDSAREFAVILGEALQLTNILRDVEEDVGIGRVYLPLEVLEAAIIPPLSTGPGELLHHPRIDQAWKALAAVAEQRFLDARAALPRAERRHLRPALIMMAAYRRVLTRLERHGWRSPAPSARLGRAESLWVALRGYVMLP